MFVVLMSQVKKNGTPVSADAGESNPGDAECPSGTTGRSVQDAQELARWRVRVPVVHAVQDGQSRRDGGQPAH